MDEKTAFNSLDGSLFVQPKGSNTTAYYQGCHDVDDIEIPVADIEYARCIDKNGQFKIVGERLQEPDNASVTITGLSQITRSWIERSSGACLMGLYILQRACGSADDIFNYVKGLVVEGARMLTKTYTDTVHHVEANDSTVETEFSIMKVLAFVKLVFSPLGSSTIGTTDLLSVSGNTDFKCSGSCGDNVDQGDVLVIGSKSAVAPATAKFYVSEDGGQTTPAASATDPFAAGKSIESVCQFTFGASGRRVIAAQLAVAANQGLIKYSDDLGDTWSADVNIGGAADGHGAAAPRALCSLDKSHIWLASALGYIYKSIDGGQTFTAKEAGVITVDDYAAISMADENYGMAVSKSGVVAKTVNGGESWAAASVVGGGVNDLTTVCVLDSHTAWVGDDAGNIFFTNDFGTTWTARTGWDGAGTGAIVEIAFVDEYVGFMAQTVSGSSSMFRTFNGGQDWEEFAMTANSGVFSIWPVEVNEVFAVGAAHGGAGYATRGGEAGTV